MPAAQVVAQLRVVVTEASEVHDAADAGGLGRTPEVLGDRPFAGDPVGALTDAVHQEDRDVDAGHGLGEITRDVGPHDLHVVVPRGCVQLARVAHEAADRVPTGEELGHEPTTHVARRAGDEEVEAVGHQAFIVVARPRSVRIG